MSTFKMELPETFSGEEGLKDFQQWIKRFELAIEFIPGANEQKHILLASRLAGSAFTIWDGLPESDKKDFAKIKDKLAQVFGRTQYLQTFRSCITARKRIPNEPLEVFASAIVTMVAEAFPKYDAEAKDGEAFRRFIAGVDEKLRIKIHEMGGTTLSDALNIALRVERANEQSSPLTDATIASAEPAKTQDIVYLQILKRLDQLERKFDKLNLMEEQSKPDESQQRDKHTSSPNRLPSPNPRSRYAQHYEKRQASRENAMRYDSPSPSPRHPMKGDYRWNDFHRRSSPMDRYSAYRSPSPRRERYQSPSPQPSHFYEYQHRGGGHTQDRQSHRHSHRDSSDQRYSPRSSRRQSRDYERPSRHVQFAESKSGNFY